MFLTLLLFFQKDIDNLVKQAEFNAMQNAKSLSTVPLLKSGQYNLPGLSFNVLKPIFNQKTEDCEGYAVDRKNGLLAIIQNDQNQKTNYAFADTNTNKFYNLEKFVTSKNNAYIYTFQKADIFTIISDVQVKTSPSKGYNCSFDNSTLTSVCQAWFGYNWQKPQKDEDPFNLNPVSIPIFGGIAKAQIGAYTHAYGSLGIDFKGFNDMAINYDLEFEAVGGVGFSVDQNISDKSAHLGEECVPIYGFEYEILGIPIVLKFDACAEFGLDNFSLAIPHRINYYRRASYRLKKSGRITPKGNEGAPFDYMLQPSSTSEFENDENFDFSNDVALEVTPTFDLYARVKFQIGEEVKCSVKIGTELDLDFHFGANNEKCLCPYLHGNVGATLSGYLRSKELKVKEWEILPKFDFTYKLFRVQPHSPVCLFSARNTMEGFSSLVSNATAPSVVLWPHTAYSNTSGLFAVRMDAFDSKYSQSLPLESMQFSKDTTSLGLSRMLVLNGFAENTNVKF